MTGVQTCALPIYNMNNNPNEFIQNKEVIRLIQEKGDEVLPITFIEGNIAKTGAYKIGRASCRERV